MVAYRDANSISDGRRNASRLRRGHCPHVTEAILTSRRRTDVVSVYPIQHRHRRTRRVRRVRRDLPNDRIEMTVTILE